VQFISILHQCLEDVTDNGDLAAKRSAGEDGQGFRRAEPAGGKRSMDATDGQSVGTGRSALQAWPPGGVAQKAETGGNILSGPFGDAVLGPGDIVLGLNSVSTTTVQTFYYSSQWQVIQDDSQVSPSATPQIADQYVWGEANVNELVLRDRHSGEGLGYNYGIANSGLDERIYALQDANWNVTSLINFTGNYVLERFTYDPYGNVTVRNCGEEPITDQYNWVYLFQGGRVDLATGLYTFQHRNYSPSLGTWAEQDPAGYLRASQSNALGSNYASLEGLGVKSPPANRTGSEKWEVATQLTGSLSVTPSFTLYVNGLNLYQTFESNPDIFTDPLGLQVYPPGGSNWGIYNPPTTQPSPGSGLLGPDPIYLPGQGWSWRYLPSPSPNGGVDMPEPPAPPESFWWSLWFLFKDLSHAVCTQNSLIPTMPGPQLPPTNYPIPLPGGQNTESPEGPPVEVTK
jgi:RHS repeat-associated protein